MIHRGIGHSSWNDSTVAADVGIGVFRHHYWQSIAIIIRMEANDVRIMERIKQFNTRCRRRCRFGCCRGGACACT
jgi:hypothetical protein